MKFVADESVDRQIVDRLRDDGHRVWYVGEMDPGISDEAVLCSANREGAILLTADKDFGELVFRQGRVTQGVILVRLAGMPPTKKAGLVASAIARWATELPQRFVVITPGMLRIRRQPG